MLFPTLDQIIGHQDVVAHFRQILTGVRPGHSYLFYGPEGVGKSTVAQAFIQAAFCSNGGHSGCGHCPACRKIELGNHADVVQVSVLEGKKQITIDQIRDLAGFLSLTPMESAYKVAMIDDAVQMNNATANAFLKTLEEPPAHALLILVTRKLGALLPTIRSRCVKTRFSLLNSEDIKRVLSRLTDSDDKTLSAAIKMGGGNIGKSLGFCQKELSQLHANFQEAMLSLPSASLSQLFTWAEQWSTPEKFTIVTIFFRTWFQEHIRASVLNNDCTQPGIQLGTREAWFTTVVWIEELLRQAVMVNLNRRLVLESILIRLARLQGATY